jgi:hypothetical protein
MKYTRREEHVVIAVPPSPITDQQLERLLAELVGHLRKREPYALVFDLSAAPAPTAVQRRMLGDHMRTHDGAIRDYVRGLAVVTPATWMRGLITAVFWLAPPPVEYRFCDDVAAALTWARDRAALASA